MNFFRRRSSAKHETEAPVPVAQVISTVTGPVRATCDASISQEQVKSNQFSKSSPLQSILISGVKGPAVNGVYEPAGPFNGRPSWQNIAEKKYWIAWMTGKDESRWYITKDELKAKNQAGGYAKGPTGALSAGTSMWVVYNGSQWEDQQVVVSEPPQSLVMSGATGRPINGTYQLVGSFNGRATWQNTVEKKYWIAWMIGKDESRWYVTNEELKAKNQAGGYAKGPFADAPTFGSMWVVYNGKDWENQDVSVSAVATKKQAAEAEAHSVSAVAPKNQDAEAEAQLASVRAYLGLAGVKESRDEQTSVKVVRVEPPIEKVPDAPATFEIFKSVTGMEMAYMREKEIALDDFLLTKDPLIMGKRIKAVEVHQSSQELATELLQMETDIEGAISENAQCLAVHGERVAAVKGWLELRDDIVKNESPQYFAEVLTSKAHIDDLGAAECLQRALGTDGTMDSSGLAAFKEEFLKLQISKHQKLALKKRLSV